MTIYQLKHFTPSAAAAISEIQKSFLDINQQRSVNEAFAGEIIKRKSNSSTAKRAFTMCQLLWSAYVFSGTRKIFV